MVEFWAGYPFINREIECFEEFLRKRLERIEQPLIRKAVGELTEAGGKRLRPAAVIASARFGDYSREKIFPLAAAVELLHTATLIHDDIIDESKLRRGTESTQSKYGKDVAVFTGDYLFCLALNLLAPDDRENTIGNRTLNWILNSVKYICKGEIQQYENRYNLDISFMQYIRRIRRKTAILFKTSCALGGYRSGLSDTQNKALASYGYHLGLIFQLTDDLLDITGKEKTTGKPALNDFSQGIYTLPIIFALEDETLGSKLRSELEESRVDKEQVLAIVRETDALQKVRGIIGRYAQRAEDDLQGFRAGVSLYCLKKLLNDVVERAY